MKLEYLDDLTDGGKYPRVDPVSLIRLFDFDPAQARMFRDAIQQTMIDRQGELDLSSLDFIKPVNCQLILRISREDEGISTVAI
jgi:hypothetical protein